MRKVAKICLRLVEVLIRTRNIAVLQQLLLQMSLDGIEH